MKQNRIYPKLTVTRKAENSIQTGHPWVYNTEILRVEGAAEDGGLVDLFSIREKYLGTGFINSHSKIRIRLISRSANDVFDEAFFERRLRHSYEYRKTVMKPQDALGKMLKNAESKIGSNYSYSGMSTDQVVALASIIEKEASGAAEMKKISSVFHNRLNAGMRLQADPTIIYIEKYVKPNLSGDINRYNSYYNTYKASALPAGAICNPGKAALSAAANPDNTDYLYFAADKAGNYYYAKTLDEHKANLAKGGIIEGGSMQ